MVRKLLFIILLFSTTLTAQVNNLNEQIQLAQTYVQTGQFDKAEVIYKALIAAQPQNNIFVERLNKVFMLTKNFKASISLLNDRVKKFPQDISAYGQLGSTYYVMDNTEKAFEIWNKALEIRPDSPANYRLIAHYMIERRAMDEGIAILKTARGKIGKPDLFAYDLAGLYTTMMKYKEAAEEYCIILLNEPNQLSTVEARMKGYIFRGEALDITIKVVSEISEKNNTLALFDLLSFLYQGAGDYERAFEYIKKSFYGSKNCDKTLLDFAQDALNKNQFSAASKAFEMLIDKYQDTPQSATARIGLARALEMEQESKNSNSAQAWKPITTLNNTEDHNFKKVMEQYIFITKTIDNPDIKCEAYYRMGLLYKQKYHRPLVADSLFQLIINNFPSSKFIQPALIQLGKIKVSQNLLEDAETYFNRASEIKSNLSSTKGEANYLHLKSKFWLNKFDETSSLIAAFSKDLLSDQANDAIELSVIINTLKSDSVGLSKYANADLLIEQGKFREAAKLLKSLHESNPDTILGELAKFKYAQILIAQDELPIAITMLQEIADSELITVFADRALYLQAEAYQFGIKDELKAINIYEKLLANFQNSLYLDKARENIIILKPKY